MTKKSTTRFLGVAGVLVVAVAVVLVQLAPGTAQAQRAELAANSRVMIDYIDPRLPKSQATLDRLRKRQVLEELSMFLSPLRLPRVLRVRIMTCGQANAYYVFKEWAINLCYEYYEHMEAIAPQGNAPAPQGYTREEVVVGGFIDAIFHELGHALFDILDIPVFGREEDAADQLSAFLMLQFGKDVARTTIKGAAYTYLVSKNPRTRTAFADEHGTAGQRFFNYMCLAYGGEPDAFRDYVDKGVLPKTRADGCAREYQLVRRAFAKTLLPHIDVELMKKVQAVQWLRPTDGRINK